MADPSEAMWLTGLFLFVALVYASVGQAGVSGYIAVMGLVGMAPIPMKTTALALNLLVASIGTVQFWRAGRLSLRAVYPSAVLGFPSSLLGGSVHPPTPIYYPVVGVCLCSRPSSWRGPPGADDMQRPKPSCRRRSCLIS